MLVTDGIAKIMSVQNATSLSCAIMVPLLPFTLSNVPDFLSKVNMDFLSRPCYLCLRHGRFADEMNNVTPTEFNRMMHDIGLNQLELAKLLDRTTRHVRRWQNGDVKVPTTEWLLLTLMRRGAVDRATLEEIKTAKKGAKK